MTYVKVRRRNIWRLHRSDCTRVPATAVPCDADGALERCHYCLRPERTWEQVFGGRYVEMPGGCWEWAGARDPGGYGRLTYKGKVPVASRLSYLLTYGPTDLHVCHRCDNPPCIRPSHLFAGSDADNIADMVAKGRSAKGETHSQAKLTTADVLAIRERHAAGERASVLAAEFGVTSTHVSRLVRQTRWSHV